MGSTTDQLSELLSAADAAELDDWARRTARRIQVPARPWAKRGYTGARLAQLYIDDPRLGTQLVVIKVLPPEQADEPARHHCAFGEAPEAFRDHFASQVFDAIPLSGGRMLTFQEPAGHSPDLRRLSELPVTRIATASKVVTKSLISDWNPQFHIRSHEVLAFLRDELADDASLLAHVSCVSAADSAWMSTDEGDLIPNPMHLLTDDSPLAGERVDLAWGRSHYDLHCDNVLIPQRRGIIHLKRFALIDLLTYTSSGQLGRDPVTLLLSVTARRLPELSESQRQLLLSVFVDPEATPPRQIPPIAVDALRAVYPTVGGLLRKTGTWRTQYLLSVVTQGLTMASFENLGATLRWWFYRLAGYAARELLSEFDVPYDRPSNPPRVINPFDSTFSLADLLKERPVIGQRGRASLSGRRP